MVKHILPIALLTLTLMAVPQQMEASQMVELIEIDQSPSVNMVDGRVHVTNAAGYTLYIYNVAGVCVQSFKVDSVDRFYDLNLSKGCYIIKVGKVARKVSVK